MVQKEIMVQKDIVFTGNVKSAGVFSFKDLYKFSHDWLTQEVGLEVTEKKYVEKLAGDSKDLDIKWIGTRKVTDYFKFQVEIVFEVKGLKDVEAVQDGVKIRTNKGGVKIDAIGTLIKDYEGQWATTPFKTFLRGIYDKWVIASKVEQYEDKLRNDCDEFLAQIKAYLSLIGRK